jgi:hypothetical protein
MVSGAIALTPEDALGILPHGFLWRDGGVVNRSRL